MVVWVMECKQCNHRWETEHMRGNENPYMLTCPNILESGAPCKHDELIRIRRSDDADDIDDLVFI